MTEYEGSKIFEDNIGTYYGNRCPICNSENTYLRPNFPNWFWGCYDCKHGFWEQYLTTELKKIYSWTLELKDNTAFYQGIKITRYIYTREYREKKAEVAAKKATETNKQLSLF